VISQAAADAEPKGHDEEEEQYGEPYYVQWNDAPLSSSLNLYLRSRLLEVDQALRTAPTEMPCVRIANDENPRKSAPSTPILSHCACQNQLSSH